MKVFLEETCNPPSFLWLALIRSQPAGRPKASLIRDSANMWFPSDVMIPTIWKSRVITSLSPSGLFPATLAGAASRPLEIREEGRKGGRDAEGYEDRLDDAYAATRQQMERVLMQMA